MKRTRKVAQDKDTSRTTRSHTKSKSKDDSVPLTKQARKLCSHKACITMLDEMEYALGMDQSRQSNTVVIGSVRILP